MKEQEEKDRIKEQAAAENAEIEQKKQHELLRQKEQVCVLVNKNVSSKDCGR